MENNELEKKQDKSSLTLSKKTVLLSDNPAEKDSFGTHESIAKAISTLIETEDGKKSIALLGSLGRGKSSVINFLKYDLEINSSQTKIFIYDAWAHTGDPLRRSFLEELSKFVIKEFNVTDDVWKKDVEALSQKREDTNTTTEPVLTGKGKFVLFLTLLLPAGYALFEDLFSVTSIKIFNFLFLWQLGLLIILSPILFITAHWVYKLNEKDEDKKESLVYLFFQKIREIEKTTIVTRPNPTSIEFRHIFTKIVKTVLKLNGKEDSCRKLIVVIDNLDRVSPEAARNIWSTMLTFFDLDRTASKEKWHKQFTLIVPFAPDLPNKIFSQNDDNENGPTHEKDFLSCNFVEKTFQSRFHIPSPIITKQKQFMLKLLEEAFPEHDEGEFYLVNRIYVLLRGKEAASPTPRDVKIFINNIGSLNRIWGDKISLPVQALYVLCRKKIQDKPREWFKDETFLDKRIESPLKDIDWKKDLATLHYNIEPELAVEAISGSSVYEILGSADPEARQSLLLNEQGFLSLAESEVEDNYLDWVTKEPEMLAWTAETLSPFSIKSHNEMRQISKYLVEGLAKVKAWNQLDTIVGQGIVRVLKITEDKENASKILIKSLSESIKNIFKDEVVNDAQNINENWLSGVVVILDYLIQALGEDFLKSNFRVVSNEEFYREILSELSNNDEYNKYIKYFKTTQKPEVITEALTVECNSPSYDENNVSCIKSMLGINLKWDWTSLLAALNERLKSGSGLDYLQIRGSIKSLLLLRKIDENDLASQYLKTHCTAGNIQHYLAQNFEIKDNEALSCCVLAMLLSYPKGQPQTNPGPKTPHGVKYYNSINALEDEEIGSKVVERVSSLMVEYGCVEDVIVGCFDEDISTPFFSAVITNMLNSTRSVELINSKLFVKYYHYFLLRLDDEVFKSHCKRLIEKDNLLSEVKSFKFTDSMVEIYKIIFDLLDKNGAKEFSGYLCENLQKLEQPVWLENICNEGSMLDLVVFLVKKDVLVGLGQQFNDALIEHISKILDGENIPQSFASEWGQVINALKKGWKDDLSLNVIREVQRLNKGVSLKDVITLYGESILSSDALDKEADSVIKITFAGILQRSEDEELEFMLDAFEKKSILIKKSKEKNQEPFRERLKNFLDEIDKENKLYDRLSALAKQIGIEFETEEETVEEGAT